MTVKELRESLALLGAGHDSKEVKVWLPGSTISLSGTMHFSDRHKAVLVEGNVDDGSALAVS